MREGAQVLLKKYFSSHHSYVPNLQKISDMATGIYFGLFVDACMGKHGKPRFELFTMKNYFELITKYRVSDCGVYLPMSLGMHLANCYDSAIHEEAKLIFRDVDQMLIVEVREL